MKRLLLGILIGMILVVSSLNYPCQTLQKDLSEYQELVVAVAPYGWEIRDVVAWEHLVTVWYGGDLNSPLWMLGFEQFIFWIESMGYREFALVHVSLQTGWTEDMQRTTYWEDGLIIKWTYKVIKTYHQIQAQWLKDNGVYYFHIIEDVLDLTYYASLYGYGRFWRADQSWYPRSYGTWSASVKEYPFEWNQGG